SIRVAAATPPSPPSPPSPSSSGGEPRSNEQGANGRRGYKPGTGTPAGGEDPARGAPGMFQEAPARIHRGDAGDGGDAPVGGERRGSGIEDGEPIVALEVCRPSQHDLCKRGILHAEDGAVLVNVPSLGGEVWLLRSRRELRRMKDKIGSRPVLFGTD